jgi:class 3 adenylate cyclase
MSRAPLYYPSLPEKIESAYDRNFVEKLGLKSFLIVPLILKSKVIGLINITNYIKGLDLSENEIGVISRICEHIVGAINSSSLFKQVSEEREKTEKARKEIEKSYQNINLLSKIGKDIIASLSVEKIIDTVHENVNKLMDAPAFGIGIYNPLKNRIEFQGFIEKGKKLPFFHVKVDDGTRPATWCFKNQKEILFNDFKKDYQKFNFPKVAMEGDVPESIMYLPVTTNNKAVGVITVQSFNKNAYTDNHVNILRNLATYSAIALDNAEAYQHLNKTRLKIEKLNQFTKQINETTNLNYILEEIFNYIETNFNIDGIWLLQINQENNELFTIKNTASRLKFSKDAIDFIDNFRMNLNHDSGLLWKTLERKRPLYLAKIPKNAKLSKIDQKIIEITKLESFLQIPLIIQNKPIGVICFTDYKKPLNLNKNDIASISSFCEQIAGAIHSSSLLKQVKEERLEAEIAREAAEIEKNKSDTLLLNILPERVAYELKEKGVIEPLIYDSVSVLFSDFVGFTKTSAVMTPDELIKQLDACFSQFDGIIAQNGLEKLKTIGDAYMCAGGLPEINYTHPVDICLAALEMQAFMKKIHDLRKEIRLSFWELRIGINTGPVTAGVVGSHKFAYDIWGDTVNTASRMESSGKSGKVNISGATYKIVKDFFDFKSRGKVTAKGKGRIAMYYLNRIKPKLSSDDDGRLPNDIFLHMYEELKKKS